MLCSPTIASPFSVLRRWNPVPPGVGNDESGEELPPKRKRVAAARFFHTESRFFFEERLWPRLSDDDEGSGMTLLLHKLLRDLVICLPRGRSPAGGGGEAGGGAPL